MFGLHTGHFATFSKKNTLLYHSAFEYPLPSGEIPSLVSQPVSLRYLEALLSTHLAQHRRYFTLNYQILQVYKQHYLFNTNNYSVLSKHKRIFQRFERLGVRNRCQKYLPSDSKESKDIFEGSSCS